MCEFKVKLLDKKEVREVTEDVLYARIDNGQILLRNVIGMSKTVPSSVIYEVSVPSANMTLITSPILEYLNRFLEIQQECYEKEAFDEELMKTWETLKKTGDKYLEEMKEELKG